MTRRQVRALRGAAAAAIAVLFASTAHTLSGGDAPPLWLIVGITILATPLCIALVGGRRSVPRLAAAVAVAQVALHAAFAAVGTAAPSAAAGHHHDVMLMSGPAVGPAGALDPAGAMMFGHAVAALVTLLVLAWGERTMAAIANGVRRVLRRTAEPTAVRPLSAPAPSPTLRDDIAAASFLTSVIRRGPPTHLASALPA